MLRFLILASMPFQLQAQTSEPPPVSSGSASSIPMAEAEKEIRLRCGSDALRQQVITEVNDGTSSVPAPKPDPTAADGDGRLILYKRPDGKASRVNGGAAGGVHCTGEEADQGTGKSAIPAK